MEIAPPFLSPRDRLIVAFNAMPEDSTFQDIFREIERVRLLDEATCEPNLIVEQGA